MWKDVLRKNQELTPNRYKDGYLLCKNNCIRPVEEGEEYCAWCGDDGEYQIPPPPDFEFDDGPPEGGHKEQKLGEKLPSYIPRKLHEKARDNYHLLATHENRRRPYPPAMFDEKGRKKEYTRGQQSFIDRATRNLNEEKEARK